VWLISEFWLAHHNALLDGLLPSKFYLYRYDSNEVAWSTTNKFSTPPVVGSNELTLITFRDMGKAECDGLLSLTFSL
jgi:hypothetical protein